MSIKFVLPRYDVIGMGSSRRRCATLRCIVLYIGIVVTLVLFIHLHLLANKQEHAPERSRLFQEQPALPSLNIGSIKHKSGPSVKPFVFDLYSHGPIVNPHPFHYTIEPRAACQDEDLFIVAYVHTAPAHFDLRIRIRDTWANKAYYKDTKIEVFFMVAQPGTPEIQQRIVKEAQEFQDIVQENFVDSYHNITYKAVGALRWVTTHCRQAKFVFKTDDDIFINTFALFKHLHDLDMAQVNNHRLLMCVVWGRMRVNREGKWSVNESVIKEEFYPPYCSGTGYIMSMDVALGIYQTAAFVPFFWIDDVYITGYVPKAMNITHVSVRKAFIAKNEGEWFFSGKDWYKYLFCVFWNKTLYLQMWTKVVSKAQSETIPDLPEIVAGKIATDYGPATPPDNWKELVKKMT